jgi:hypothetical protein
VHVAANSLLVDLFCRGDRGAYSHGADEPEYA